MILKNIISYLCNQEVEEEIGFVEEQLISKWFFYCCSIGE
jgi:hypothetical protein